MTNRLTATALAALLAGSVSAHAGGLPEDDGGSLKDTGYTGPVDIWTGFYVGAHAGYADGEWDGDLKTRHDKESPWKPAFPDPSDNDVIVDGDGWLGGGQIGYNWQRNNIVLGVEGDLSWTNFDGNNATEGGGDTWHAHKKVDAELDYFGTARVRLGYAADRLMPYITGGFAWGESEVEQTVRCCQRGNHVSGRGDASETHVGWTIGGGVEAMLGDGWSAKAEYLYVDLGEEDYVFKGKHFNADGDVINEDWGQDGMDDVSLDFHTIRVGVNYNFN